MIAAIAIIAEQRIQEAMIKGEFDDLPCKGASLDLAEDAAVPPELRMAWKLLKNGGYLDGSADDLSRNHSLDSMLRTNPDERIKLRQMLKLQVVESRFARKEGRTLRLAGDNGYQNRVVEKLSVQFGGKK